MERLIRAIAAFNRASDEMETAAILAKDDPRNQIELEQSRAIRDMMLDSEIRGSRAERYVLEIPIIRKKRKATV